MDGQHGIDKAKEVEQGMADEQGNEVRQRDKKTKRIYAKEATATIDVGKVLNGGAEDIIRAIKDKIGVGKILAVRPKMNKQYEVTFEKEEDCDALLNGLQIKGQTCEVRKLQEREYVVSFMHLPVYMNDNDIIEKLQGWGVIATTQIKRRFYPGTDIEDGTRYVKVKFPKEVASLPYSTRFETAEGLQHFRIIHSKQVKTCRLCISPEHILKDCPEFKCFKCEEQGHFARDCKAVKCPECDKPLVKCECWMGGNEEVPEEQQWNGRQKHGETADNMSMIEVTENNMQQEITESGENKQLEEKNQREEEEEEEKEEEDKEEEDDKEEEEDMEEEEDEQMEKEENETVGMESRNTKEGRNDEGKMEKDNMHWEQQEKRREKEKSGFTRRSPFKVKPNLEVARKKRLSDTDKIKMGIIREQELEKD